MLFLICRFPSMHLMCFYHIQFDLVKLLELFVGGKYMESLDNLSVLEKIYWKNI